MFDGVGWGRVEASGAHLDAVDATHGRNARSEPSLRRASTAWRLPVARSRRRPAGAARADRSSSTPSSSRRGADTHAPLPRVASMAYELYTYPAGTPSSRHTERTPIKTRRTCPRPSSGSSTSRVGTSGATRGAPSSRRARRKLTLLMIYLRGTRSPETTRYRSRPRCGRPSIYRGRTRIDSYLLPMRMWWIPRRRPLQGF